MDDRKWAQVPLDVLQELDKAAREFIDCRTDAGSACRLAHSIGRLSVHLRKAEAECKEAA